LPSSILQEKAIARLIASQNREVASRLAARLVEFPASEA